MYLTRLYCYVLLCTAGAGRAAQLQGGGVIL